MLTIGELGAGQERYYLDKVAEGAEDYYCGEGEAEGRWLGDAAEELGLHGRVEADQLTAMLTARNPLNGEPFGMRVVPGRGPVPGFDLTFSAPKSVSLLWALGGPQVAVEVKDAHRHSVEAALHYIQCDLANLCGNCLRLGRHFDGAAVRDDSQDADGGRHSRCEREV